MAHLSLHHFFDWRWFSFRTFTGWMVIIAHTFNALAAALYLMVVVRTCWKRLNTLLTRIRAMYLTCMRRIMIAKTHDCDAGRAGEEVPGLCSDAVLDTQRHLHLHQWFQPQLCLVRILRL